MSYKRHREVILGVIPARSNSKGLPKKNIKSLLGKPLIAHTIEPAEATKVFDRLIISTDSLKIGKLTQRYGAEFPFLRPKELARDETPMIKVLKHAIRFLEKKEKFFPDIIVLLQPTSPLRKPKHILQALEKFFTSKADSLVSICEAEHSPYFMQRIVKDRLIYFTKEGLTKDGRERYSRRQDLPKVYRLNGAIYITKRDLIMKEGVILGKDTRAIIMEQEDSIDIDTEADFLLAELILKRRLCAK